MPTLRTCHAVVLSALTTACGAAALPQSPGAANRQSNESLHDDFAQRFAGRVLVAHYGRGRILASGPPLDEPRLQRPPAEYVVVNAAQQPRIVVEERGVRFLLYLDPADLQRVATHEVELIAAPPVATPAAPATTPFEDAGAVAVLPGATLHVRSQRGAWTEIEIADTSIEARGWIPSEQLGVIYVPVPAPTAGGLSAVRSGAVLRDRPDGNLIARFVRPVITTTGPRRNGVVSLDIALPALSRPTMLAVRARGFVLATDVVASTEVELSEAGEAFELTGSPHHRDVPPGVRLHASVGGEAIGVTLPGARPLPGERRGAWLALAFDTAWGQLVVWAEL